jgi:glycerol-3-phosphate dehydrogenase
VRPLVVGAAGAGGRDWMQLSRKHAIETSDAEGHVTIFGGKLTDCLNVGEEVCSEVQRLGVGLPWPARRWYGEPPEALRDEFHHQARLMGLDGTAPAGPDGTTSERLWRRHGAEALGLLEAIRRDPRAAEPVLRTSDVLRCEVALAGQREMVVGLDDFLRRRTGIAQVVRAGELRGDEGLEEACRLLFGEQAEARRNAWLHDPKGPPVLLDGG